MPDGLEIDVTENKSTNVFTYAQNNARDHYNCAGVVAKNNFNFQHLHAKLAHNEARSIAKSFRLVEVA